MNQKHQYAWKLEGKILASGPKSPSSIVGTLFLNFSKGNFDDAEVDRGPAF